MDRRAQLVLQRGKIKSPLFEERIDVREEGRERGPQLLSEEFCCLPADRVAVHLLPRRVLPCAGRNALLPKAKDTMADGSRECGTIVRECTSATTPDVQPHGQDLGQHFV